jgi:hypothetical protein
MKKEPGPYFHLSLSNEKIEEIFDLNLGFYKIPTLAYYGENYPYGGKFHSDPLCIVRINGDLLNFPERVHQVLQSCEESYYTYPPPNKKGEWISKRMNFPIPQEIDFFWVVSDLSELKHVKNI